MRRRSVPARESSGRRARRASVQVRMHEAPGSRRGLRGLGAAARSGNSSGTLESRLAKLRHARHAVHRRARGAVDVRRHLTQAEARHGDRQRAVAPRPGGSPAASVPRRVSESRTCFFPLHLGWATKKTNGGPPPRNSHHRAGSAFLFRSGSPHSNLPLPGYTLPASHFLTSKTSKDPSLYQISS